MLQVREPVRINKLHFMNSNRLFPGRYSCAIDSFLELWLNKLVLLPNITTGNENEFFALLTSAKVRYEQIADNSNSNHQIRGTEFALANVREYVWEYLRDKCPSFRAMNCDAQFSEIFTRQVFGYLSELQKTALINKYCHSGNCSRCSINSNRDIEVFVHYVARITAEFPFWPEHLVENCRASQINCSRCSDLINVTSFNCSLSDVIFVEFSPQAMTEAQIEQSIVIGDSFYQLQGMVRNTGSHFTCAYYTNSRWFYVDDLIVDTFIFESLGSLVQHHMQGWFFFVYIKFSLIASAEVDHNYTSRGNASLASVSVEHNYSKIHTASNFGFHMPDHDYTKVPDQNLFQQRSNLKASSTNFDKSSSENVSSARACKNPKLFNFNESKSKKSKSENCKKSNTTSYIKFKQSKNKFENTFQAKAAESESKKFHESMKMTIKQCNVCFEAWPVKNSNRKAINSDRYVCGRCKRDKKFPKKFSQENNMIPSRVPNELKGLTQCEEMLISRAFPVMLVYTRPGAGYFSYKGHVITLPHNVQNIANILPNLPEDLPIVRFQCGTSNDKSIDFKVRREKVLTALQWLVANNPLYRDVTIDFRRVHNLPEDDFIGVCTHQLDCDSEKVDEGPCNEDGDENDIKKDIETISFLPVSQSQPHEKERLEVTLRECEMQINQEQPFNEFTTQYLATMCFPCLFPDGKGDPTFEGNRRSISDKPTENYAQKLKHLIKFAELENQQWDYRFASHPRFAFWAYNMLYRKRLLIQGSYYISKNSEDELDIHTLREMLENDAYSLLMKKITYYAKNIAGTNSYWNQQKNNLKATICQLGAPTIFWTLSCAEFHWPEFHSLLSDTNILSLKSVDIRNNVVNNHHLLDWFFTERTESFVKHWLYNSLGASWHWFRYEFTVNRGSIHCHGLAKLKSDPGLCDLSKIAIEGFLAKKQLDEKELDYEKAQELKIKVNEGKSAEKTLCEYHDQLMSTCNPVDPHEWTKPSIHPCKKSFKESGMSLDDYSDLVNSVQRHTKCNSSYCLRKDSHGEQYCRFKFPYDLTEETYIEYQKLSTKNEYRAVIVSKRNDSRLNRHQRLQLQTWRGNCDIQLIIDYHACLEYLAKYASKSEKMSSILKNAFVTVIESATDESDPKSIVKKLLMKGVGERDMSIQEVMHSILSLKLVSSTFNVIIVSLTNDTKLNFKDGDIHTTKSCLDKYANRCEIDPTVRSLNLIDFFANYITTENSIKKLSKPVIVRTFPVFSPNPNSANYGMFCKYQLVKYKPWQDNISSLWCNEVENDLTFINHWQIFLNSEVGRQNVSDWELELNNTERYFAEEEQGNEQNENDLQEDREEWMYLSELIPNCNHNSSDNVSVQAKIAIENFRNSYTSQLIAGMPFWLENMKSQVTDSRQFLRQDASETRLNAEQLLAFNIVRCHYLNMIEKPLFMIVTGQGGSGKSYLIDCLKNILAEKVVICSYFGLAAYNVGGVTLHSYFQLPIFHRNNNDLKGISLQRLQMKMSGVKYVIIDEFSVIGQKMFGWIDRRCRQSTGKMEELFGGLSLILVGDVNQLPPVNDSVLYHTKPKTDIALQGLLAYKEFKVVVRLFENIRAAGVKESQFRKVLTNAREGKCTVEDWELLQTRNHTNFGKQYKEVFSTKLAYSNKSVAEFNFEKVKSLSEPVFSIKAKHNMSKANQLSSNDFGGLEAVLYVCKGAKVMLTRNLWIDKGLCNGSIGYVQEILYKVGDNPPDLPIAITVQFDNYTGPSFRENTERLVPIVPVRSEIDTPQSKLERIQIPLKLCWAMTIHKSQGLTLRNVTIDIGSTEKVLGLSYVALSRAKSLEEILLEPFSYDRLQAISKCKNFDYRLHEQERLSAYAKSTFENFKFGVTYDTLMQYL